MAGDALYGAMHPVPPFGFFPDMAPVWDWLRAQVADKPDPAFLNLFGYTGVGSQALAAVGASVTHVDASKKSVGQARENAALAGMADKPVRWILDDASKFTAREVRREKRYDAILLDPPKFGRGPTGERWQLEEGLAPLLADCRQLLDADSRALFLTVYACACRRWRSASCSRSCSPICPEKSNAASWRCAKKRGGCCCPPQFRALEPLTRHCKKRPHQLR